MQRSLPYNRTVFHGVAKHNPCHVAKGAMMHIDQFQHSRIHRKMQHSGDVKWVPHLVTNEIEFRKERMANNIGGGVDIGSNGWERRSGVDTQ